VPCSPLLPFTGIKVQFWPIPPGRGLQAWLDLRGFPSSPVSRVSFFFISPMERLRSPPICLDPGAKQSVGSVASFLFRFSFH